MNATQLIDMAFKENPEILVVLEIARRARETEDRELPREIVGSTEVAVIPTDSQYVFLGNQGMSGVTKDIFADSKSFVFMRGGWS